LGALAVFLGKTSHWQAAFPQVIFPAMKIYKLLTIAFAIAISACSLARAQEQTNQFAMTWNATGYTLNANGRLVVTNLNQRALVVKVAQDNGLNPNDLEFVYRVEKRDTAVVWKSTGVFVSDVYQMEYTYDDVSNLTGSVIYRETLLNDEYHTNAIGTTWGVEESAHNRAGYLTFYTYHGNFHYFFPEDNVIFTGSFSTGARVRLLGSDD
jgi:hypothetical protein